VSQQTYPVACECSTEHRVTAGQAGSSFDCGCGRKVEVPTLGALKRSVGQSAVSADLEIEHRLKDGSLPVETECVICDTKTDETVVVGVVCEQSEVQTSGGIKWWYWVFFPLGIWFYFLLVVAQLTGRERQVGREVAFRLPVRVCGGCGPQVRTGGGALNALRRSPLYARLLAKYPHGAITPPA
jgi:hypothetical protein